MAFAPDQYIVLDTETTGLDPEHADIIELAAIPLDAELNPREGVKPFHTFIQPQPHHPIAKQAIEVNGHTWVYDHESETYKNALPYDRAWTHFYDWMATLYEKMQWIITVGWNVSFDEAFLRYLHAHPDVPGRAGSQAYVKKQWPFHYHKIDLIGVCRYLDLRAGRTRKSYKLEKMAEHYFGSISDFHMHTALGDADMSLKVLRKMEQEGG